MPAERTTRVSRHTSSLGEDAGIQPGPSSFTSGSIAFAPNVTPGTYNDPPPPFSETDPLPDSLLFPASSPPSSATNSKSPTTAHGRKKPASHIPRPPNAFILFRSSFIRSRHVSTGVETNHSTLSKIIGLTWQNLPEEERQVWHRKAKQAEAEHRAKFPAYAFKPLHGRLKAGGGKRKVREVGPKDHVRCAKIAELLVKGLKGRELDEAIGEFDKSHVPEVITRFEQPITESSFESESRPASAPIPEERKREREATPVRKLRSASSPSGSARGGSLRRSTLITNTHMRGASPALSVASSLASSFDLEQVHSQPHQLFAMPPLDNNFPFEQMKHDPSYDFTLFSFDPGMQAQTHPPMHSFGFDPHPHAHPHPSDSTYSSSHPPLPQFHLDASYITPTSPPHSSPHDNNATNATHTGTWLPCSPSTNTNGSMPVTPVYPGSLPLPMLQEEDNSNTAGYTTGYVGYYGRDYGHGGGDAPPAYHTLQQKMPRLEAPVAQYGVGVGYEELAGYGQY
ncbi:hypothetical protein DFP72DRAFT_528636 [Ephemerocybe angulata]|uniref:HMG box domain-containing protein n=1 Tax=Ephemerocybe angulata TaxID=980116 RepID=A0A8H6ID45_9AGAR|nr:hypothetical protein DFP72DRAFT_528636 [Tulosesus angulatus]